MTITVLGRHGGFESAGRGLHAVGAEGRQRRGAWVHAVDWLCRLSCSDNLATVIRSFGNRLAEDLFDDRRAAAVRRLPPTVYQAARRKLLYLHEAEELRDLRVPPGNRLEALKGDRAGWYSIRINDQWRVVFRWETGQAIDVSVLDYH